MWGTPYYKMIHGITMSYLTQFLLYWIHSFLYQKQFHFNKLGNDQFLYHPTIKERWTSTSTILLESLRHWMMHQIG